MLFKKYLIAIVGLAISQTWLAEYDPKWEFGGSYRLRYENVDNTFHVPGANISGNDSDQLLAARLLASIKFKGEHLTGELELQDARTWLDDDGTPLGNDDVNTLEPLQAWIGWQQKENEANFNIKAGRFTADIGSRRLVARNRFRNTLNAFTGVHADYRMSNWQWQFLYTLPMQRLPVLRRNLNDNQQELDEHFSDIRFYGLHLSHNLRTKNILEVYYFGLEENNQSQLPTRNRNINTAGFRFFKPAQSGMWDYELEAARQWGSSKENVASQAPDDLDVSASFIHAHLAYKFADKLNSRIVMQADYASGDDSPADNQYNRFDTLYGARRFDFGPTGIYGAFARSNIISSGLKWEFKPESTYAGFIGYRLFWLASDTDALATTVLRDPSGESGSFVGQQVETCLQVQLASALQAEIGGAYLLKGEFFQDVSPAADFPLTNTGDTLYVYTQLNYKF